MTDEAPDTTKTDADGRGLGRDLGLFTPRYLRRLGQPASVIDVGVNLGTPELYRAFPGARFLLIDPQSGGEARMTRRPANYVFANVALGAAPGRVTIQEQGGRSSALQRTALTERGAPKPYEAAVTTLDALIDDHALKGPIGLKIDTEGYEIEVLKGLERHVADIAFVICEASVRRRFVGGYTFADLVIAMKAKGFEFYNILNPPKARPNFYDVLFLPSANPLFD